MKKQKNTVQFIKNKGKPEWAVIPYEKYLYFQELEEIKRAVKKFKKDFKLGKEELMPSRYAHRIMDGEHPIRVWREYREISAVEFAKKIDISVPYLSQLESYKRKPSLSIAKKIAKLLHVSIEDLV